MADTFTTIFGFILQQTGNNSNTWGDKLNTQAIQLIEDALAGRTSISTTGGTTTLTQAQARPKFIDVSGALGSNATIVVPSTSNEWVVRNQTSGGFSVLLKTAGQATPIEVPQSTTKHIYCDATNVIRMDAERVGEYFYTASTTGSIPAGALECDGATYSIAAHPDLYAKLGNSFGGNGTTTAGVPDAKTLGRFLRSRTGSVVAGTLQADNVVAHSHGTVGSTFGFTGALGANDANHTHHVVGDTGNPSTGNTSLDHQHTYETLGATATATNAAGLTFVRTSSTSTTGSVNVSMAHGHSVDLTSDIQSAPHSHGLGTLAISASILINNNGTAVETRPVNISAILCVRL
jgi:microcystin-dependent protein